MACAGYGRASWAWTSFAAIRSAWGSSSSVTIRPSARAAVCFTFHRSSTPAATAAPTSGRGFSGCSSTRSRWKAATASAIGGSATTSPIRTSSRSSPTAHAAAIPIHAPSNSACRTQRCGRCGLRASSSSSPRIPRAPCSMPRPTTVGQAAIACARTARPGTIPMASRVCSIGRGIARNAPR